MKLEKRVRTGLVALAVAIGLLAAPATATPPDESGNHKVTICHVTNSAGNPYVEITIDVAAFEDWDNNDHSHHVAKDGRRDFALAEGRVCEDGPGDPED